MGGRGPGSALNVSRVVDSKQRVWGGLRLLESINLVGVEGGLVALQIAVCIYVYIIHIHTHIHICRQKQDAMVRPRNSKAYLPVSPANLYLRIFGAHAPYPTP